MNATLNSWTGIDVAGNTARFSLMALAALAAVECERTYPIELAATVTESDTVAPISGKTVSA